MKHFLFVTLLVPSLLIAASARAADDPAPRHWLDYHEHPHGPAVQSSNEGAPAYRAGTKVYGWSYRSGESRYAPAAYGWNSCGVYHYWDGSNCVDARDSPP